MNNLFFFDSAEPPKPPAETRILDLNVTPYPDGSRVRMALTLTPFEQRPNLELFARKVGGPIVAEMSVIETMTPNLEFTIHIRGVDALPGEYTLRVELYYEDRQHPQDSREVAFTITLDPPQPAGSGG